ncbi:MAG: MerR family transcriptional regulator [Dehalococcoidales bacterium]|nr:MerR family transcriptional regulator [Dehalococcoidales bacterium]
MMVYTVKKLADVAGISVRTLHYYDERGLLKPKSRTANGYRYYDDEAVVRLQQIMFFRELGFGLDEISKILADPDFDVIEALQSQKMLLSKKADRINELIKTIEKTIKNLKEETEMPIKEYYEGFSDEQIEKCRQEVRERWGEKTLKESEERILNMGKEKFKALQEEGGAIFKAICDNMPKGYDSKEVQELVGKWRNWLENFSHYSDEAVLGLGQTYSRHPDFAKFFEKYDADFPEFFTKAIEYYCYSKE